MLFAVFVLDKPGTADTRKAVHADHVAHLKKAADSASRSPSAARWSPTAARRRSAA